MTKQSTYHRESPVDRSRKTLKLVLAGLLCAAIVAVAIVLFRPFAGTDDPPRRQAESQPGRVRPESRPAVRIEIAALQKEAIDVAREFMKAYPGRSGPIALMGVLCSDQGNADKAIEWWEKCLQLDPNCEDAYRGIGELMAERGQYDEAVALLRKAMELNPTAPLACDSLGQTLMKWGKMDQAVAVLEKGVEVAPKSSRSHLSLAQAYLQAKEYDQAKRSYEEAIARKLNTRRIRFAYYGLSIACARMGQADEAGKYREKFKEARAAYAKLIMGWKPPSHDDVVLQRRQLAATFTDVGSIYMVYGNPVEAERLWLRAASLDPRNTKCLVKLGSLYSREGRKSQALQICQRIRAIEPENPVNYLNIGILREQLKRFDDAEIAFKKVIRFGPKRAEGHLALAKLYMKTNRMLPEAKVLAARAVELKPSAANYFILSEACNRGGDVEGRRNALQWAVELDPDNVRYRLAYEMIRKPGS